MYCNCVIFCFSGEGTLTSFNIRRKKMEMQSELFDSEFLSLALLKVSFYLAAWTLCQVVM